MFESARLLSRQNILNISPKRKFLMKRHIQMGHLLLRAEDLNRHDKVTVVSASCDAQHPSFDVKRFVLGGVECS